ncbi:hypothetical protein PENSPDRAFT_759050 [Peniophora sp. CONT]|nr:hypothetical protein PENSPDRAFT_759050 [Peniophora sp. CONT]
MNSTIFPNGGVLHSGRNYISYPSLRLEPNIDPSAVGFSGIRPGNRPTHLAPEREDPLLRATFGPLRISHSTLPREFVVGRAPDSDFMLENERSSLVSTRHCKLIWDGNEVFITDLKSANGTWVNHNRLADGEIRVLRDKDRVSLTPLPLDRRRRIGFVYDFDDCLLGQRNALVYMYHEHSVEKSKLSRVGHAIRQSMNELLRVRASVQSIRRLEVGRTSTPVPQPTEKSLRTYRGSLDRPDRPETPIYAAPWSFDMIPDDYNDSRKRDDFWPGPNDPDGLPADHPDLIWLGGARYKHAPDIRPIPEEIRRWSTYYNLPVGLHPYWPLVSSVEYGARNPELTPERREKLEDYVHIVYPDWALLDAPSSEASPKSLRVADEGAEPCRTPPVVSTPGSCEPCAEGKRDSDGTEGSQSSVVDGASVNGSPSARSLPTEPSATTEPSTGATVRPSLQPVVIASRTSKRPRADDCDNDRPAKRPALSTRHPIITRASRSGLPTTPAIVSDVPIVRTVPPAVRLRDTLQSNITPSRAGVELPSSAYNLDDAFASVREVSRLPKRGRDSDDGELGDVERAGKRPRTLAPQSVRRSVRVREKAGTARAID